MTKKAVIAASVLTLITLFVHFGRRGTQAMQAQGAFSPAPATHASGLGAPNVAPNNITCNVKSAGPTMSSIYIQRDLAGNNIWKCQLATDGVTYAWQAPAQQAASYTLTGTNLGSLRCAYGTVTTSTSGTVAVSYSAMAYTTIYWVGVQSVATASTASGANNANVSAVTTTGATVSVTTPTTISILGTLTVQLVSAATPVYFQVCGV